MNNQDNNNSNKGNNKPEPQKRGPKGKKSTKNSSTEENSTINPTFDPLESSIFSETTNQVENTPVDTEDFTEQSGTTKNVPVLWDEFEDNSEKVPKNPVISSLEKDPTLTEGQIQKETNEPSSKKGRKKNLTKKEKEQEVKPLKPLEPLEPLEQEESPVLGSTSLSTDTVTKPKALKPKKATKQKKAVTETDSKRQKTSSGTVDISKTKEEVNDNLATQEEEHPPVDEEVNKTIENSIRSEEEASETLNNSDQSNDSDDSYDADDFDLDDSDDSDDSNYKEDAYDYTEDNAKTNTYASVEESSNTTVDNEDLDLPEIDNEDSETVNTKGKSKKTKSAKKSTPSKPKAKSKQNKEVKPKSKTKDSTQKLDTKTNQGSTIANKEAQKVKYPKIKIDKTKGEKVPEETTDQKQDTVSKDLTIESKETTKRAKLTPEQVTKAKKTGIILGVLLALVVFIILGLPKFKEVLAGVLPEQEDEKPLILGDDPPVKPVTPQENANPNTENKEGTGTEPQSMLNIGPSEEDENVLLLSSATTTSKVKFLEENRGLTSTISTPMDNVSIGQTKFPEKENQFCVIKAEVDKIVPSKINPKRRYISISHPDNTDKRIVVESSTKALVELLDNKTIKKGSTARITMGFLGGKMIEKYKDERKEISKKLDTPENFFFSVEEYQILTEDDKKEKIKE
jgi:hypothetical protein